MKQFTYFAGCVINKDKLQLALKYAFWKFRLMKKTANSSYK